MGAFEFGRSEYPYRGVEYAYTYDHPPTGSLTSSFLAFIAKGESENVIREHGHLPCSAAGASGLCAGE